MSHDGSEDPIDYTIYNAIYDLIKGVSAEKIANDLGWDLEKVLEIHPEKITDKKLALLADENYWPDDDNWALDVAIKKYRSKQKSQK